ncbi:DUF1269 domain-containing protein [Argonema antarcticum]|uniref:DUF1269 domain-containing protein n=1 Tax=Argonema antarcticum TaxID=2942763 RepID=UPI0020128630|nr:DUF1269 domain-containing protein [Argonema antarcticum]MCL1469077.1 DUF1269 domain-containing protein [Argonema antarcticum A004/B2]
MELSPYQRAFGIFSNSEDVRNAFNELEAAEFPMDRISAVAKDPEKQTVEIREVKGNKAQEGTTIGAIAGATVGGSLGLAVGLATAAALPAIGPVVLLGAAATALATTLTGGMMGATAGSLIGALIGWGIPEEQATVYRDRIYQGDYLVMVDGSEADIRQAEAILSRWNIQEFRIYDIARSP